MTTANKSKLSLCAGAALLFCAACGGPGNTGQTPIDEQLESEIPWLNGGVPVLNMGQLVTAPLPVYPAIGQNLPDPGSAPIDCSVLAPYEFAPWVATAEPADVADEIGADPSTLTGIAARWAGADDLTRGSWRTPGFTTWYPGLSTLLSPTVWGTPGEAVATGEIVPQCDGQPNNWVIHMRGAGFRYYGGNIAHILAGDNYPASNHCPPGSDLCPPSVDPTATTNSAGFPLGPTENGDASGMWQLPALHTYWDGSAYDGISFWARRGPDSMGTLLITLAEKDTADDMNRQNETYCKRIFACHNTCQAFHNRADGRGVEPMPCNASNIPSDLTVNGSPVYRCFDPADGGLPMTVGSGSSGASDDLLDAIYPRCGQSACTFRTTYPDADFEGKDCRPYTFTSGESAEYCFNADDPPPPSRFERCGDGFTSTLQLSEDWAFYTVPFMDMRQGGYGKVAPEFDLKSLYSLTLGWGPGNMDIFIDNVTLYRAKKL